MLWDIVGYTYRADTYCPSCVLGMCKESEVLSEDEERTTETALDIKDY